MCASLAALYRLLTMFSRSRGGVAIISAVDIPYNFPSAAFRVVIVQALYPWSICVCCEGINKFDIKCKYS